MRIWGIIFGVAFLYLQTVTAGAQAGPTELQVVQCEQLRNHYKFIHLKDKISDEGLMPFNSRESILKSVSEKAIHKGAEVICIMREGQKKGTNKLGVSGVMYHNDAYKVSFREPTLENLKEFIRSNSPKSDIEASNIFRHVERGEFKNLDPEFVAELKDIIKSINYKHADLQLAATLYFASVKSDSVDDLKKFMKYHENDGVREGAGLTLIRLRETAFVEEGLKSEKTLFVVNSWKKALMN